MQRVARSGPVTARDEAFTVHGRSDVESRQRDGNVAECDRALPTISTQFWEKESTFWNSDLRITRYARVHEVAFRPWQSDNIPRRYCSGDVMLSDGKMRTVHYSIIEDGGFAGFGQGVEWCVTGLDRAWAYSPGCRAARP